MGIRKGQKHSGQFPLGMERVSGIYILIGRQNVGLKTKVTSSMPKDIS